MVLVTCCCASEFTGSEADRITRYLCFIFYIHDLIPLTFAGAQGLLVVLSACLPCLPMAASQPSLDAQVPEHLLDLLPVWRLQRKQRTTLKWINALWISFPSTCSNYNARGIQCSETIAEWDIHTHIYLYICTHTFFPWYKHHKKKCLCSMCMWMHNCIYQFVWLHINAYIKKTPVCRICNVFIISKAFRSSLKSSWL